MSSSTEVRAAVGEKPTLEERAAALRADLERPAKEQAAQRAELAHVERQLAEEQAADARAEAERRMLGISRAHGSLVTEFEEDKTRLKTTVAALRDAIERANGRFEKLLALELEARDLNQDAGVPLPKLTKVLPPAETTSVEPEAHLWSQADQRRIIFGHQAQRERAKAAAQPKVERPAPRAPAGIDASKLPSDVSVIGQF
jgi:hypothetical protein